MIFIILIVVYLAFLLLCIGVSVYFGFNAKTAEKPLTNASHSFLLSSFVYITSLVVIEIGEPEDVQMSNLIVILTLGWFLISTIFLGYKHSKIYRHNKHFLHLLVSVSTIFLVLLNGVIMFIAALMSASASAMIFGA